MRASVLRFASASAAANRASRRHRSVAAAASAADPSSSRARLDPSSDVAGTSASPSSSSTSSFFSRSFLRRFFLGFLNVAAASATSRASTSAGVKNSASVFFSVAALCSRAPAGAPPRLAASRRRISAFLSSSAADTAPAAFSVRPSSSFFSSYFPSTVGPSFAVSSSSSNGLSAGRLAASARARLRRFSSASKTFSSSSPSSLTPVRVSSRMLESFRVSTTVSPSATSSAPCRTRKPASASDVYSSPRRFFSRASASSSDSESSKSSSCSASLRASSSALRFASSFFFSSMSRLLVTHALRSSSASSASPSCAVARLRASICRFSLAAAILAAISAVSLLFSASRRAACACSSASRLRLARSLSPVRRGLSPSFSRTRLVSSRDMETSPPASEVFASMPSGNAVSGTLSVSPSSRSSSSRRPMASATPARRETVASSTSRVRLPRVAVLKDRRSPVDLNYTTEPQTTTRKLQQKTPLRSPSPP